MHTNPQLSVHGDGGAQSEIYALVAVPAVGVLLRNLFIPWITHGQRFASYGPTYWYKFLADFVFIVAPIVAVLTLLSDSLRLVHITMISMAALLLLFIVCEYSMVSKEGLVMRHVMNRLIEDQHEPTTFLTYFRSLVFLSVTVSILGVDFSIFPRRFAKTITSGHSLMDTGVAAFIIASGIVKPLKTTSRREETERRRARNRFSAFYSSTILLVALGAARTLVLWLLGYPYEVSEYGVHWNFFYTIAVVNLVSLLLPSQFTLIIATTVAALHQIALSQGGLQEWVLDEKAPRVGLLEANREGVCSLGGYIALFCYARAMGRYISRTGMRLRAWSTCVVRLLFASLIFLCLQYAAEFAVGAPSRRTVNLPYIFAMVSLFSFLVALCVAVQVVSFVLWAARFPHFGSDENPFATSEPCLLTAVNRHALLFFLVSNVSTGVINMGVRAVTGLESTLLLPDAPSFLLLMLHSLSVCAIAHAMCAKRPKAQ